MRGSRVRIFAIGDIHGCGAALRQLLELFDLRSQDRVVTLGDYVNKGPDSKGVLDQLTALYQTGQLVALRGNHELKLLRARNNSVLADERGVLVDEFTLASYGGALSNIPAGHWQFVERDCVDSWETDQHLFVHATLDPNRPLSQQPPDKLFWEKFGCPAPHSSGKVQVCGHTRQKDGRPVNLGHAICIDTWACGEGWLTGLEVLSGEVYQVKQTGKIRRTHIERFRVKSAGFN